MITKLGITFWFYIWSRKWVYVNWTENKVLSNSTTVFVINVSLCYPDYLYFPVLEKETKACIYFILPPLASHNLVYLVFHNIEHIFLSFCDQNYFDFFTIFQPNRRRRRVWNSLLDNISETLITGSCALNMTLDWVCV